MPFIKKLPWLSLTLLLVTYSTFGWFLSTSSWDWLLHAPHYRWFMLGVAALAIIPLAEMLAAPWSGVRNAFVRLLLSDARAFILILLVAILAVALATWIEVFAHILVLIAAELLARLELHTAQISGWSAFWVLAIASLAGLGLGWALHAYLYFPLNG